MKKLLVLLFLFLVFVSISGCGITQLQGDDSVLLVATHSPELPNTAQAGLGDANLPA